MQRVFTIHTRGVRTQVFSSPIPVLIQEVGILILIRNKYEIRILKKSC